MASLNASNIAAKELFSQQSSSLEIKRLQAELEATKRKLAEANEQISLVCIQYRDFHYLYTAIYYYTDTGRSR